MQYIFLIYVLPQSASTADLFIHINFRVPCVREVNHRCSYELIRIVFLQGLIVFCKMNFPPFIDDYDIAAFGAVDPWGEESFQFNNFALHWRQGKLPHYKTLLYIQVDGEPRLIGRYIKEHQVNIL